ncbi:alpha/beta hydrolase [Phenylobacterium sp.]|uniref:alpha/beta fold hydrolase n=1 Tax=Phenylobacterium sp. TaxID=1871053 RepID=UPI0025E2AEAF|nr:alpha/beta hydrolase [Phenylobacterium sp.]MBX3485301.1 alpha/beta hydrolase [Phenylobacterium sp.]MCW5760799.1 alpha/beta hydrolase [Phenylobacterium sp.]
MLRTVVAVAITFASAAQAATPLPVETYYGPHRLVTLPDGRRMNLFCLGEGAPTVVLDAGYGSGASTWRRIHATLAETTRVCAYDRAGNEFSDPGPLPRTAGAVVEDERAMLKAAGVKGPYVLVGHSMAGLHVRLYASKYPKEVAGAVLVDPSNPRQKQRFAAAAPVSAAADDKRFAAQRACSQRLLDGALKAGDADYATCFPPPVASLPEAYRANLIARRTDPARIANLFSEVDSMPEASSAEVEKSRRKLGNLPWIVLTADGTARAFGGPPEEAEAMARLWSEMHDEAAALSTRGENRHVDAGHYIWATKPDAVIDAVNEVVAAVRARR